MNVTISTNAINIGHGAFWNCEELTSVTIPNGVKNIGDHAFYECWALNSVTLPSSVTNIGLGVFGYGFFFTNIAVDVTNPNYTSSGGALFDKAMTTLVECPNGFQTFVIPNGVTSIASEAFRVCNRLTSVTLPASLTSIGNQVFESCKISVVTIPAGVTNIGAGAFTNCPQLNQAYIQGNAPSVNGLAGSADTTIFKNDTTAGRVFYLPNTTGWGTNFGGWTTMARSDPNDFTYITNGSVIAITGYVGAGGKVGIPNNINGYPVTSIGTNAFYNKSTLSNMFIPRTIYLIPNGAFASSTNLTNISVDVANPVYASAGGVLYTKDMTTLFEYPAGVSGSYTISNSVTTIADEAFYDCYHLTSVKIPNGVTSIGNQAFQSCSGLTNVTIPASVTSIGTNAFASSSALHQAYFLGNAPSVNGGAGSADSTVFQNDTSGTVLYLPNTTGWGATYGGWPTAVWQPQLQGAGYAGPTSTNGFGFNVNWASGQTVVLEASTNLQNWTPLITNTLVNGTNAFCDSACTNYPQRFYRVHSP